MCKTEHSLGGTGERPLAEPFSVFSEDSKSYGDAMGVRFE